MTREELHALVDSQYDKLADLQAKESFYAFEEGFVKIWTELGGQVLQASLDKVPSDKRKKTSVKPAWGK
ncbi:hypothetical protein [Runella sp.]|uniref:hypothetical protein n=1 Tax=Runella sp. TaxID=1960881 RepID=UPI003D0C0E1E